MKKRLPNKTTDGRDQTRIVAMGDMFSAEECSRLISNHDRDLAPALVDTMDLTSSSPIRKSSAVFVPPSKATLWVFERLDAAVRKVNKNIYGFSLTQFKEGFQFTRYEPGEYYKPHFDIGAGRLAERKLSLTVQLSSPDEYSGGELVIYPDFVAPKERGTMTIFPSFMCHDVRSVVSGVRYSLVSWVAGPAFK